MRHTGVAVAVLLGALGVGLIGCAGGSPSTTTPATSSSSSPTSTAVAPRDQPTPTVEQPIATCDDAFTDEENASLAADGLEFQGPAALGSVGQQMGDAGALQCEWATANTDIAVWFARLPVTPQEQATWEASLAAEGFSASDDPLPGTLLAPESYDANYRPVVIFADGVMYFASYPRILGSVAALQ